MRSILRDVLETHGLPEHIELAYDAWAPIDDRPPTKLENPGSVPDRQRHEWLSKLAKTKIPKAYKASFHRWKRSFDPQMTGTLTIASRLLIGHGNTSATGVGISVQHTWGMPIIPGSALKGLCANYVASTYGPDSPSGTPMQPSGLQADRIRFQGVTWDGNRIRTGPGEYYRELFGAPEVGESSFPASAGRVTFHDALYDPECYDEDSPHYGGCPFGADVLTIHQRDYYLQNTLKPNGDWANDFDSPNPVSFISVKPGARFLLALTGPGDWVGLARHLLIEALANWGVGGKTSAGYGIGVVSGFNETR